MKTSHPVLNSILSVIILLAWTIGCILLSQLLLSFLFQFLINTFHLSSSVAQTLFSVFSYLVAIVLIIFVPSKVFKKAKTSREELGLTGLPTWTDIGLAPVGFVVYVIIAAVLNGLFTNFSWYNSTESQDLGFNQFSMSSERVLAFFTLVIFVPIAEELIFRGFLYAKLKKSLKKIEKTEKTNKKSARAKKRTHLLIIIVAALLTSLAFAIMHGQWNVGLNVFVMSLVLCAMREITGTIYSGIVLHMLKNAVAFFLVFITGIGF